MSWRWRRRSRSTARRTPTRVVWIVFQGRLKKVRGSQLRHASETEKDIANANTALTLPWTFTTVVGLLEKGTYDDYTNKEVRGRSASGTRTPNRGRSRSRARSVPREGSQPALWQPPPRIAGEPRGEASSASLRQPAPVPRNLVVKGSVRLDLQSRRPQAPQILPGKLRKSEAAVQFFLTCWTSQ